jgi:N4-gp56 family major capsid protein
MTGVMTTTGHVDGVVQNAYEQASLFAFMENVQFDQLAQVKWSESAAPQRGNPVYFHKFAALAAATTPLNESTDVNAVPMDEDLIGITLAEYGNAVTTTELLRVTSLANIDYAAARLIGENQADTLDILASTVLAAGTNKIYPSGVNARIGINHTTNHVLKAELIRKAYAKLRAAKVPRFDGGFYVCAAHPHTIHDLRAETGSGAWRAPKEYVDPKDIYNGEVGLFEGFRFIDSSNCKIHADSSGNIDTYGTYCMGYQALGKAMGLAPQIVIAPPTDKLRRFAGIGWKALQGYGIVRQESIQVIETLSTLGANT